MDAPAVRPHAERTSGLRRSGEVVGSSTAQNHLSQLAQRAVSAELTRLAEVAELDNYLAELEAELGPTNEAERAEATAWADKLSGIKPNRRSA